MLNSMKIKENHDFIRYYLANCTVVLADTSPKDGHYCPGTISTNFVSKLFSTSITNRFQSIYEFIHLKKYAQYQLRA